MKVELERCALIAPRNDDDWVAYHDIRRRILFERRGEFGVYDPNLPDEHAPGHHPKLLVRASTYLGVVRIDVVKALIERYYEGHSPEKKRAALEQLAALKPGR